MQIINQSRKYCRLSTPTCSNRKLITSGRVFVFLIHAKLVSTFTPQQLTTVKSLFVMLNFYCFPSSPGFRTSSEKMPSCRNGGRRNPTPDLAAWLKKFKTFCKYFVLLKQGRDLEVYKLYNCW